MKHFFAVIIGLLFIGSTVSAQMGGDPFTLGCRPASSGMNEFHKIKTLPKWGDKVLVDFSDFKKKRYYFGFVYRTYDNYVTVVLGYDEHKNKIYKNASYSRLYSHPVWDNGNTRAIPFVDKDESFLEWHEACFNSPLSFYYTPLHKGYCNNTVNNFISASLGAAPSNWFNSVAPFKSTYFVQKLQLTGKDTVFFWSDLHGDYQALLRSLGVLMVKGYLDENFVLDPNVYLVGLGDYTDRCQGGLEVLQTLFRLKACNPKNVILLRGNHEDENMNEGFGFGDELYYKLGKTEYQDRAAFYALYNLLPAALYIQSPQGDSYLTMLCCHGAPEFGFSAKEFLASEEQFASIDTIDRGQALKDFGMSMDDIRILPDEGGQKDSMRAMQLVCALFPQEPTVEQEDDNLGFFWDDCSLDSDQDGLAYGDRGFVFGKTFINKVLDRDGIDFVLRGHQHGEMFDRLKERNGYASLYDGRAGTLLSGNSDEGGSSFMFSFCRWQKDKNDLWQLVHMSDAGARKIEIKQ